MVTGALGGKSRFRLPGPRLPTRKYGMESGAPPSLVTVKVAVVGCAAVRPVMASTRDTDKWPAVAALPRGATAARLPCSSATRSSSTYITRRVVSDGLPWDQGHL